MAKEAQDIRLSIEVPVSASEYAYLEANANGKAPAEKLAAYTKWLFTRQVAGGLMLDPQDMEYLANINKGVRFATSRDVVKAVEIALKREEGQYSFTINIDPTLIEPLNECAGFQNVEPRELVDIVVNQVLTNSWCYEFTPAQGRIVPLEEAAVSRVQRLTGKGAFTGADVAVLLERLEALEKGMAKPGKAA